MTDPALVAAAGLAGAMIVVALVAAVLAWLATRRRTAVERRVRLLATAVEVSHAVGATLDPAQVFRTVYAQVRSVLEADAFFVAIASEDRTHLTYRFLVDKSMELEPRERELEGTLAGLCI